MKYLSNRDEKKKNTNNNTTPLIKPMSTPVKLSPPPTKRRYIRRDREGAHERLVNDYFADEPRFPADFIRCRFRMSKRLFLRIVGTLEAREEHFKPGFDATGRASLSPLPECTSVIRQLATRQSADIFDEYLHIGKSTGILCLKFFYKGVRDAFGDEFLRAPTTQGCQRILQLHEAVHEFTILVFVLLYIFLQHFVKCVNARGQKSRVQAYRDAPLNLCLFAYDKYNWKNQMSDLISVTRYTID